MKRMRVFLGSLFLLTTLFSSAQNINLKEDKWVVKEKVMNISGIDISPDKMQIAIVCASNAPVMIYDWISQEVLKEIDIKADMLGYNIQYSAQGNFLLLQEKSITTNIKKAKLSDFLIIDIAKGEVIHRFKKIADLKIGSDEKEFFVLDNGQLSRHELSTGKATDKFELEHARNAIAVSPDGKELAIVVEPTKEQLMNVPSVRNDKKAVKGALKYKHMIAIYDLSAQKLKIMIPEIYDNINTLAYSKSGDKLLNFNAGLNSYVNVIDAKTYEPSREAYMSRTSVQPDFSFNDDGSLFGVASVEKFPTVNIYKAGSGSMLDHYNTENRIWKSMKKKMYPGSYSSFVFLPDGENVLIAYGNALIKWKIEK